MTGVTIDSFLAALRLQESGSYGGNYVDKSSSSSASGAYGYIDSTWANYGGYAHAWQAPKPVQDARARADVTNALTAYKGDWQKVAAQHFAGGGWVASHPDEKTWNVNPAPGTRNPTVRSYVDRVLKNAGSGDAANPNQPLVNPYVGNQTGSSIDNSATRPADWIGALDALLNPYKKPKAKSGSTASNLLNLINPVTGPLTLAGDLTGISSPGQALDNLGGVIQLVAVRTGLAIVGMMMFGAGLVLLIGPEILHTPGLGVVAPEAAALAATVKTTHTHREERAAA